MSLTIRGFLNRTIGTIFFTAKIYRVFLKFFFEKLILDEGIFAYCLRKSLYRSYLVYADAEIFNVCNGSICNGSTV